MTSPLDEISFKLGEISAGLSVVTSRLNRQDNTMSDIQTSVGEIKTRMKPLADDVARMKPHVQHYAGVRRFGALIIGGLASGAALAGGLLTKFIEDKFLS